MGSELVQVAAVHVQAVNEVSAQGVVEYLCGQVDRFLEILIGLEAKKRNSQISSGFERWF